MNIAIDWLSVSVRTPKEYDIPPMELMIQLVDLMHLNSFWKRAVCVGAQKYYASIYRIDDISFKLCKQYDFCTYKQGVMIEFTSNGLARYQEHLASSDLDLYDVLRDVRSLSAAGFKINFPRLDVCMDDICHADRNEKPLLRLDNIFKAWCDHEFCSRARPNDGAQVRGFDDLTDDDNDLFKDGKVCDKNKKGLIGRTIYFGNRKSAVCVRFYDKKVEQLQKGKSVSDDIIHWVRCEYEFHNDRACAVIAMLIEHPWDEFIHKFSACILGHLRFINPKEKNRSRCPTRLWWVQFLNNICTSSKFIIPPKKAVQADKTVRWVQRSVAPTLYAQVVTRGASSVMADILEYGKENIGFKQIQYISDFVDCKVDDDISEELRQAFFWSILSERDLQSALDELEKDFNAISMCRRYRSQLAGNTEKIIQYALELGC